jgi:hypothetical protein
VLVEYVLLREMSIWSLHFILLGTKTARLIGKLIFDELVGWLANSEFDPYREKVAEEMLHARPCLKSGAISSCTTAPAVPCSRF